VVNLFLQRWSTINKVQIDGMLGGLVLETDSDF
jgi:hypothetical protein